MKIRNNKSNLKLWYEVSTSCSKKTSLGDHYEEYDTGSASYFIDEFIKEDFNVIFQGKAEVMIVSIVDNVLTIFDGEKDIELKDGEQYTLSVPTGKDGEKNNVTVGLKSVPLVIVRDNSKNLGVHVKVYRTAYLGITGTVEVDGVELNETYSLEQLSKMEGIFSYPGWGGASLQIISVINDVMKVKINGEEQEYHLGEVALDRGDASITDDEKEYHSGGIAFPSSHATAELVEL